MSTPTVLVSQFPGGPRQWFVKAGTTLNYYDPNHPGAPVKSLHFTHDSSAHADATVFVSWPGNPNPPIPRGGPFLRCVDGAGEGGLLIVAAQVTFAPTVAKTPMERAMALRVTNPFEQFGQPANTCILSTKPGGYAGGLGCTDTVLQFLILLWTKRWVTHDQIRRIAGYTGRARGLYPQEVRKVVNYFGLPYLVYGPGDGTAKRDSLSVAALYAATRLAPVGIGMSYSYWPEWQGFIYKGIKADGHPNGFALPAGKAGKTQLTGIQPNTLRAPSASNPDGHYGLLIGVDATGHVVGWEPNHGSGSRPERPAYDLMTGPQFAGVYNSYKAILDRDRYALVPTRALP